MNSITIEQLMQLPGLAEQFKAAENAKLAERQALIDEWRDFVDTGRQAIAEKQGEERKLAEKMDKLTGELKAVTEQRNIARTAIMENIGRNERKAEAMKKAILAGADPMLNRFTLWAQRAANLASFASHFTDYLGFSSDRNENPPDRSIPAIAASRKVNELVQAAIERADQMRLEAISYTDMVKELKIREAEILDAFAPLAPYARTAIHKDFLTFEY